MLITGFSAGNPADRRAYVRDEDRLCWCCTVTETASYRGRLSAQNWTSSRQLQQSSAPRGETEEMAKLPYMTYSSVQCDGSQTTKGQSWQLSLVQPSVHLDAETGRSDGEHVRIKGACIIDTGICFVL